MSYNEYEMNYVLDEMKAIIYDHEKINKLVIVENEKLNHFICKATLFYVLRELDHDMIPDFHVIGVGSLDLYDLSARTIYMFDTDPNKLKEYQKQIDELYGDSEVEVIAINMEELPDDIFQRYLKLKEYVFSD